MRCGELTPSARIPRLPMETLSTLFFQLRLDHPEIFYAVGFSCRAVPEAAFVEFWPEYRFEKKRIREHRQAIEARVTRLLRPLRSLPPVEQERAILAPAGMSAANSPSARLAVSMGLPWFPA